MHYLREVPIFFTMIVFSEITWIKTETINHLTPFVTISKKGKHFF